MNTSGQDDRNLHTWRLVMMRMMKMMKIMMIRMMVRMMMVGHHFMFVCMIRMYV